MGKVITARDELARERNHLVALTLAAMLDAIILALLSAQFLAPPALIALICIAPVIFALQVLWTPFWVALESGMLVVLVATAIYGPVIGIWACAYILLGTIYGVGRKLRMPSALRVIGLALALVALAASAFVALIWLGGMSLSAVLTFSIGWVASLAAGASPSLVIVVVAIITVGVLLAALLAAILIEVFGRAVTRRVVFELPMRELRECSAPDMRATPSGEMEEYQ